MASPTTMTPEAKARLSATVRGLRDRLLADLHDALESAWRMALPLDRAGLDAATAARRARFEAWVAEQVRTVPARERAAAPERFRRDVEKQAAYTLLNRLVYLRLLEAAKLSKPEVVTAGWESRGYAEFREFAPGLCGDATEGYATLLDLVYAELAEELPGLYGDVGLVSLVPVPPATLRAVVTALNDRELASCWTDDTTLGWVYQYWNDPEREALDAKLNAGGKVEPHEIASKTQMFTERYMVEWLLQNSLGAMWLATCRKRGWTADAEAKGPDGVSLLDRLEARRADWRRRREAGEVTADALMPIEGDAEERWKYWVPQPIPDDAVERAPESVRGLRVLDPACGSGHFLVLAFDLLFALYREEARHTGADWSDDRIAAWILEDNLHGLDIDPRAVQIAAAALLLKARTVSPRVHPKHLNLVASNLRLGALPADDPTLLELRRQVKAETGIPEALVDRIVGALQGADHLGSLLRVDAEVERAIRDVELRREAPQQPLPMFGPAPSRAIGAEEARASVLDRLERFLAAHADSDDLGLRLRGEQLAAGVRFVRLLREGSYDLVVANPPYQGTAKMADARYVATHYPRGKADLYAAFLERGLQLVREGGVSAMVTMRNWMFLGQFEQLRKHIKAHADPRCLSDLGTGAFGSRSMDDVISTMLVVVQRCVRGPSGVGLQIAPLADPTRDAGKPARRQSAQLCQVGRHEFHIDTFEAVPGGPWLYWWPPSAYLDYSRHPLLGSVSPARFGANTGDNTRFLRRQWEVSSERWVPYFKGGEGREWIEPGDDVCNWRHLGLEPKVGVEDRYGNIAWKIANERFYFKQGVAFTLLGNRFSGRLHRRPGVIDSKGSSIYGESPFSTLCLLNTTRARDILSALNPTLSFQVGDVNRLPLFPIEGADEIYATLDRAFTEHEAARETSVEFKRPGPSPWRYAQDWAQRAVDRPAGEPLPAYVPEYDPPRPEAFVTCALGVALGRFDEHGEGILDAAPAGALPDGILYLSAAGAPDDLDHPACAALRAAWEAHGAAVAAGVPLRDWLKRKAFDVHRKQYENRPIWWALSSEKRSFVAWVAIHRWTPDTLRRLRGRLDDDLRDLDGRLRDLSAARAHPDRREAARAEALWTDASKLRDELAAFVAAVAQCAEKGPPDLPGVPAREADARYAPDLDDGVMVNAAALWPLLEAQWKDPKAWWKELATAKGRKDYDWSHLAARYFPARVDAKCQADPSLAVAHGCFWRYHPARAYAWELRLQDELRPDFMIDEPDAATHRARFLAERSADAREIEEKERRRRERARARGGEEDDEGGGQQDMGFGDAQEEA